MNVKCSLQAENIFFELTFNSILFIIGFRKCRISKLPERFVNLCSFFPNVILMHFAGILQAKKRYK